MAKPKQRLVYRITHVNNVPWILENGLHANSSPVLDPNFVSIGNPDLIQRRAGRAVPIEPRGTLNDYVPFYFCMRSLMLYQIHTGWVADVEVSQSDVVYLVSSVEHLVAGRFRFVFTDRHAYVENAQYDDDHSHIETKLDWTILERSDFKRDPNDPDKLERRMAELLVHQYLPVTGLIGLACLDMRQCMTLRELVYLRGLSLPVASRPGWYFP